MNTFYFRLSQPRHKDLFFKVIAEDKRKAYWKVVDESVTTICSIKEIDVSEIKGKPILLGDEKTSFDHYERYQQ